MGTLRGLTEPGAAVRLCRHLPDDAAIGRGPDESLALIGASIGGFPAAERDLRDAVVHRIRQDHAEGRTVILRGWTLALTEARLAALWRRG